MLLACLSIAAATASPSSPLHVLVGLKVKLGILLRPRALVGYHKALRVNFTPISSNGTPLSGARTLYSTHATRLPALLPGPCHPDHTLVHMHTPVSDRFPGPQ